ncbi:MAG: ABC transporter permease, partial [Chloroflexota bacterium]|nr:ABC transporter permease [Chloroflexota bacterium]
MGHLTQGLARSLLAVLGAMLVGVILLTATGHDPLAVGQAFGQRVLLRGSGLQESAVAMAPVLIAALAAWVAARVGLWNIGIDGQVLAGAIAAAALAPLLDAWPRLAMWCAATIAAMLAGALWALIPALLRVRGGINEIVTTIMMTYVAFSLGSWLVKGPLRDESVVAPTTVAIEAARRLPRLFDMRIHLGVLAAVVVVLLAGAAARWTSAGILSWLVGDSAPAAHRLGLPVGRYLVVAFLTSGGIAALAGVTEV